MFRKKVTFSLVSVIFPKDLFSDFNTLSSGNEMNVSFQVLITSALKLILDLKIASIGINMSINGAHFFLRVPMYSPEYGIYKEGPAEAT